MYNQASNMNHRYLTKPLTKSQIYNPTKNSINKQYMNYVSF